ncbi:MAG: hypothetical protein LUC91_01620 [Prevotella sp.]|nr:hypothetical protein [Prevotella sp.]
MSDKEIEKKSEKQTDILSENSEEPVQIVLPVQEENSVKDGKPAHEDVSSPNEDVRDDAPSLLKEAIRQHATEDERPNSASLTLRKILGGDFLTTRILRNQIWIIVIIAAFTLVYVSNRYSCQRDIHEINALKDTLKDAKYKALASSSELTEMCRESNVLKMLKNSGDSILQIPNQPPYIIKVPKDE